MTLKQELFTQIKIAKDGNCLFRSLVIFLNETLLKTRRNRTGLPTNTKYHDYEDAAALFLRKTVVRMIETHKNNYSDKLFYDDELYDSIDDRIDSMSTPGEFAGKLEMDIIAKMNQIVICVFICFNGEYSCIYRTDNVHKNKKDTRKHTETDIKLDIVDDYDDYSKSKYCFLLLEDAHYTLLEPNYKNIQNEVSIQSTQTSISKHNILPNPSCYTQIIQKTNQTNNFIEIPYNNYHMYEPVVSDHSFLSSSNSSSDMSISNISSNSSLDKCFERIENTDISNSIVQDVTRLMNIKKNGLILNISHTPRILEMRDSYKKLTIEELIDVIESVN
tara:strand:+ start:161 stop:1156 length:996 start_codon:yes stop_codon:yes gene_type:complete